MNTKHSKHNDSHFEDTCCNTEIGSMVPDYIVELLDDAKSAMVEENLAVCQHCKRRYLTILRIRAAAALKKKRRPKQLTH